MLINCEHFIYAPIPKRGFTLIKSPSLNQILSRKSLHTLMKLDGDQVIHQTVLPEGLVAISFVKQVKDEYNREGTYNHTILVSVKDYLDSHPPTLFEPYFIKHVDGAIDMLEPLVMKT